MQPEIPRMLPGTLYVGVRYTQKIFPVEQYQKKVHTTCFFSARHPVQLLASTLASRLAGVYIWYVRTVSTIDSGVFCESHFGL